MPSPSTNNFQSLNSPLSSAGTMTPCTSTVTTITAMLTSASVLALANYPQKSKVSLLFPNPLNKGHPQNQKSSLTFAISRYNASG